jgi:cytochrome b561
MKPCAHCGLGDLSLSMVDCRWRHDGTPPCALDEATEQRAAEHAHAVALIVFTAIVIAAILMAGFLVSTYPRPAG